MSSIYYEVFVNAGAPEARDKLTAFLDALDEEDLDAIQRMPEAHVFDSVEESLEGLELESVEENEGGIFCLRFDSNASSLMMEIFDFFRELGITEVEAALHNSQVGETTYYANGEHLDAYEDATWKYLSDDDGDEAFDDDDDEG